MCVCVCVCVCVQKSITVSGKNGPLTDPRNPTDPRKCLMCFIILLKCIIF